MYQNNHSQKKHFIKFLFVLCFSFLIFPAFSSEDISTNLAIPNSETEDLTVSNKEKHKLKENAFLSVWKISSQNSIIPGTAFAIGPNQMITSFEVFSRMLKSYRGSLDERIVFTQSGSSSQIQIKRVINADALYNIVLFETEETVSNYLELKAVSDYTDEVLYSKDKLSIVGYFNDVLTILKNTEDIFQVDSFSYFPVDATDLPIPWPIHISGVPIQSGVNGSPVLNIQGEVVGVAYDGLPSSMLNFTKAKDIHKVLDLTPCSSSPMECFEEAIEYLKQTADVEEKSIYNDYLVRKSRFAQYMLANLYWYSADIDWPRYIKNRHIRRHTWFSINLRWPNIMYGHYLKAEGWIERSAKQGLPPAQYMQGYLYDIVSDKGIIETMLNKRLARKWYQKAADQGFEPAKKILSAKDFNLTVKEKIKEKICLKQFRSKK